MTHNCCSLSSFASSIEVRDKLQNIWNKKYHFVPNLLPHYSISRNFSVQLNKFTAQFDWCILHGIKFRYFQVLFTPISSILEGQNHFMHRLHFSHPEQDMEMLYQTAILMSGVYIILANIAVRLYG